ncbi:MAG: hypothetical protein M1365_06925 [Actinobacteria bacterium]|nr:hypothetical protein [Actinomycetota bacterium]
MKEAKNTGGNLSVNLEYEYVKMNRVKIWMI